LYQADLTCTYRNIILRAPAYEHYLSTTMPRNLETALNATWELTDPLVAKATKTVQSSVQGIDHKIDYVDYYWCQPIIKFVKKTISKIVKAIKDLFMGYITWLLLIVVNVLMTVEALLDTFLPSTIQMRARVVSSMSTTKDTPMVRIKRHLVSVTFRPLFAVTQIPLIQTVFQKTWRIAVFLSDEVLGEKTTDAILNKVEACIPQAVRADKPGTLRGLAQSVVGSYQAVIAQRNNDAAMAKVRGYMPSWQAEPANGFAPSTTEKKYAHPTVRSRSGTRSDK